MDVILHVGAHRTASTSFQAYMRAHADRLEGQSIGFWGPWRTRDGLLADVLARPDSRAAAERAAGRLRLNLQGSARRGTAVLIISDENIIGTPRACLRAARLYPQAGERMARLNLALGGVRRITLQIRAPELWWASALAFLLPRGAGVPDAAVLADIAASPRSWRHVIADLSCACPEAELCVTLFEHYAAHPDRLLARMSGALFVPQVEPGTFWANRSPDLDALRACLADRGQDGALPQGSGRWMPFTPAQAAQLRETYADDLFWLRAGADGLARLTEEEMPAGPAKKLAARLDRRGSRNDRPATRLAPTR